MTARGPRPRADPEPRPGGPGVATLHGRVITDAERLVEPDPAPSFRTRQVHSYPIPLDERLGPTKVDPPANDRPEFP